MKKIIPIAILIYFINPLFAFGSGLSITEIMYDAEGTDSGREWIEIYNQTGGDIDITQYKFVENSASHSINKVSQDGIVENNTYIIIAENPEKFSIDFPDVKKEAIYDASFSLSNSVGENLYLKDPSGEIVFSVTYDVSLGAKGNGQSLQFDGSKWLAANPTPASAYVFSEKESENNTESITSSMSMATTPISSKNNTTSKEPTMKFVFNIPKTVIVGQQNEFSASLYGYSGESIHTGKFIWNFGDGTIIEQTNLSPVTHVYAYAGNYVVSCSYRYNWINKNVFMDKVSVNVINSPFVIDEFYSFPFPAVKISNTSNNEYDLYGYHITSNVGKFSIHENTYIGGKDEIFIRLPNGDYDENSIKLLDSFDNMISSFVSQKQITEIKEIPKNYKENNFDVSPNSLVASVGSINKPIYIEDPVSKNTSNQSSNLLVYVFFIFILAFSAIIIWLTLKDKNNTTDLSDEYTLQDE